MPSDASELPPSPRNLQPTAVQASTQQQPSVLEELPPTIARWVKTECGRAKYQELALRRGGWARLRRWWFVLIAALRDWRLPPSARR